jgi:sugar lactone lactonase YvrE
MLAGDILELSPDGTVERAHVGEVAAVFRPRSRGGMVIAIERGLALTETDDLHASVLAAPELWSDPNERMNEGGCDPAGAFYAGTTTYDHLPGGARLQRFDADLVPHPVLDDVTVSNGIEWSPDLGTAYYVDSTTRRVDRFSWTPELGLHDRRLFVTIDDGEPDGLTVDAEGGVWVALWGGSAVHRYESDGSLSEVVALPVRQVSAVAFYGEALDRLMITTSRKGLGGDAEPSAGALFTADVGVKGMPLREFSG